MNGLIMTMILVISMPRSCHHCESSFSSDDECRLSTRWPTTHKHIPATWAVNLPVALHGIQCNRPCLSVRPTVCFHSNFWTEWPLTLTVYTCMGRVHRSPGIGGQGQRSSQTSKVKVKGRTRSVWARYSVKHSLLENCQAPGSIPVSSPLLHTMLAPSHHG